MLRYNRCHLNFIEKIVGFHPQALAEKASGMQIRLQPEEKDASRLTGGCTIG